MGMPNWICEDGRSGGPACKEEPDGTCRWRVVRCPPADAPPVATVTVTVTATPAGTPTRRPPAATATPPGLSIGPGGPPEEVVAAACAKPCAAGQARRGILRCLDESGTPIGVAGPINCPAFSITRREHRPLVCASVTAETGCAERGRCLKMDGTCCDDREARLVVPTGSLGNMYCGSPGQFCSRCKCLPGDAHIATPDGDRKIRELATGDRIWSEARDGSRIAVVIVETVTVPAPPGHRFLEIALEDGRVVRGSPTHPTADGTPLEALTVGAPFEGSRVSSVRRLPQPVATTHDVLPAGETGIYWVDGVRLRTTIPPDPSRVASP